MSRSPRPRRALLLLGTAAVAACGLPLAAQTSIGDPGLPDLVSHPVENPATHVYRDGRLLIRFDGFVSNAAGAGPLEVRGHRRSRNAAGELTDAAQYRGETALPRRPGFQVIFETADGHDHYHLKHAAEYTLWTEDQSAQVALAQKTEAGFCLEDSQWFEGNAPRTYSAGGGAGSIDSAFCRDDEPLIMGISPGWRDRYHAGLSFQWIDVSAVQPGRYRLGSRPDPLNVIHERDDSNNGHAFVGAVVPGYRPTPVAAGRVEAGEALAVTLGAERFASTCFPSPNPNDREYCSPGPPEYIIESLPARGTLRQGGATLGVGSRLSDPRITYVPGAGQRGPDGFTYSVRDSGRPEFPTNRAPAGVSIQVGAPMPAVMIAGAPPELAAGLGVQLSATVSGGPPEVVWSASAGSISASGLFVAPDEPPPGGVVTVRAQSVADPAATGSAQIRIVTTEVQRAAPTGGALCAVAPRRPASSSSGRVRLAAEQLLINQRISQAAVRRANAIHRWLDAGIRTRDLCGRGIGVASLGPGLVAGPNASARPERRADPRPLPSSRAKGGEVGRVELSRRQLLINQRISQTAVRRLNALRARIDGGLTGGDLAEGALTADKLVHGIRIIAADGSVPRPAASTMRLGRRSGGGGDVELSARQLLINQRIAQAAVRRANALQDTLRRGLIGDNFRDGSIVARNLAPDARP